LHSFFSYLLPSSCLRLLFSSSCPSFSGTFLHLRFCLGLKKINFDRFSSRSLICPIKRMRFCRNV
jgi:hypothetical protein